MIEVKELVKVYGEHVAVDHLSFTVEEGHIYGFLGPNGAGKSTTMNMMTGYIGATEGTIIINGHDMAEEPEAAKKCIGYLPELPPLYMDMTPREYLKFAAELKGIEKTKRPEAVADVMKVTKIEEVADRLIKNLSKGYKQRVGLAQALIGYPEVIILDEPTVGLDPAQIIEIRELIKSLGKKHTVILSSHILSEISAVCDDILILSHGKLVACDTTDNIGKMMADKEMLQLTIRGAQKNVQRILEGLSGVSQVTMGDAEEKGCVTAAIESAPDVDVRDAVFYALAEAHCPILSMVQVKKSLEDVFIELTADDSDIIMDGEIEELETDDMDGEHEALEADDIDGADKKTVDQQKQADSESADSKQADGKEGDVDDSDL